MSTSWRFQAKAKINLALHVLGRRDDGYHDLDSLVAFTEWGDSLEISPAARTNLTITGPFAQDLEVTEDNLILTAHRMLTDHCAARGRLCPSFSFVLTKNLPIASGIGGGSADAAAALSAINDLAGLRLNREDLQHIALAIGADVPICVRGRPSRLRGIGEHLVDGALPRERAILLVNPGMAISTPAVFAQLGLARGERFGTALDETQPESWRNDLAKPAEQLVPAIAEVLSALHDCRCFSMVRMSGSGATCFGLAGRDEDAAAAAAEISKRHPRWWVKATRLSS